MAKWGRIAVIFALLTIAFNSIEGICSIYFGMKKKQLSLFGFGLGSTLEVISATIVYFQLTYKEKVAEGKGTQTEKNEIYVARERKATLTIGILLLILSLSVITNAIYKIVNHLQPETALFGLLVSIFSLGLMYWIYTYKLKAAQILKSPTLLADCKCTMGCMREGLTLLLGSGIQIITINLFNS